MEIKLVGIVRQVFPFVTIRFVFETFDLTDELSMTYNYQKNVKPETRQIVTDCSFDLLKIFWAIRGG